MTEEEYSMELHKRLSMRLYVRPQAVGLHTPAAGDCTFLSGHWVLWALQYETRAASRRKLWLIVEIWDRPIKSCIAGGREGDD